MPMVIYVLLMNARMQATGMVNDYLVSCFRLQDVKGTAESYLLTLDSQHTIIVYCFMSHKDYGGNNMSTCTVNIAFQKELLQEIDEIAKEESRSRSEFLREAARAYIQRKKRWADIFSMGRMIAKDRGLLPEDVSREIEAYRKEKASRK